MGGFYEDPSETVARMTGVERTHFGIMKVLRRNWSILSINLRDLTPAVEFMHERREMGEKVTRAALLIRAVGLALKKYPRLGWMARGWRLVKPSTADVGCSVGTESPVSPVVVIRDAGNKGLLEINEELTRLVVEAREKEAAELAKIERASKLIPFGWLYRFLLWILMTRQQFIRHSVGNFQVTLPRHENIDFGATAHTVCSTIMSTRPRQRPMVVDGEVVARPSVYYCFHFDHGINGAEHGTVFIDEVYRLLDHPEELL